MSTAACQILSCLLYCYCVAWFCDDWNIGLRIKSDWFDLASGLL